jgi:hypothetical protein
MTATVLAAGWEAFELIREAAFARAHGTRGSYATWMSVIPAACEGRNILGPPHRHMVERAVLAATEIIGLLADGD